MEISMAGYDALTKCYDQQLDSDKSVHIAFAIIGGLQMMMRDSSWASSPIGIESLHYARRLQEKIKQIPVHGQDLDRLLDLGWRQEKEIIKAEAKLSAAKGNKNQSADKKDIKAISSEAANAIMKYAQARVQIDLNLSTMFYLIASLIQMRKNSNNKAGFEESGISSFISDSIGALKRGDPRAASLGDFLLLLETISDDVFEDFNAAYQEAVKNNLPRN